MVAPRRGGSSGGRRGSSWGGRGRPAKQMSGRDVKDEGFVEKFGPEPGLKRRGLKRRQELNSMRHNAQPNYV